ncbi:hypothetical protein ACLRGF_10865 [Mycetocola zhadangensis]|jgi:hypothetical protein|uniref:hypothetical protein n=1 Tax=Mycetocola zhadangensis TaxID=1164595 RepID=UPI003A4E60D2
MTVTNPGTPADARAELVATLNAIEDKLNVPRKVNRLVAQGKKQVAVLQRENPAAIYAGIAAVASVAGLAAWAIVRSIAHR